jgi:pimeloyl-ACP methyl ester carboxylesterase
MNGPAAELPMYLGSGGDRFFAIFNPADRGPAQSAVLICPPFGWEEICSYRSRRLWARQLAGTGHPVLRLDWPGSGDSAGGPDDPDRLDAWTRAVFQASDWLSKATGAAPLTAIGIGLGGIIACRAALQGAGLGQLVLWGASARGRDQVRELRAFSRLEVAATPSPHGTAAGTDGSITANGHRMSAQTAAELGALELTSPSAGVNTRRALLLSRDTLRLDEGLRTVLEKAGVQVQVADGTGYGAMTVEPQDARPPTEVFATVGSWLEQEPTDGKPSVLDGVANPPAVPPVEQEMELSVSGVAIRERPIIVERPEGRLVGVLTEPAGRRRELTAVLLNAGPQRRIGPNRMWVQTARRWASMGVSTLRVDMEAIGDSDGDDSALVRVAALYQPAYVGQVEAVLDALSDRGLPQRFVLLGLCSGAYWAMHTAAADERVSGIMMLNPRALIWDEWEYTVRRTRELRERLLRASTWRRALRGELTLARHLETAKAVATRALSAPGRTRGEDAADGHAARTEGALAILDTLSERGQRVLVLLTGAEPLRAELAPGGVLADPARWPGLELALMGTDVDTHTLAPAWLQQEVSELVDRRMMEELELLPD